MALIDFNKLQKTVKGVSESIGSATKDTPVDKPQETLPQVINTPDEFYDALIDIRGEMSPSLLQVIKSQLQVLGVVNSSTMTGMMIDNLVQGLKLSLESADPAMTASIKQSYIQMIQNYVFMAEAKMHYMVDKNKDEAKRLLGECSKMLADSFMDAAMIAIPAGKAGKILKSVNKSMFTPRISNGDLISKIVSFVNTKKVIEEKEKEFYDTVENLFDTFDKHPQIFGTSIIINGMLAKYKKILVARYTAEKVKIIKNQVSISELEKLSALSDNLLKSLKKISVTEMVKGVAGTAIKGALDIFTARKSAQFDLEAFFVLHDSLSRQQEEVKLALDEAEKELTVLKEKHKDIGFFHFSEKKESSAKIDEQMKVIQECKKDVLATQKKLKSFQNRLPEAKAIKDDIDRYAARLTAIEEKYFTA